MKNWSKKVAAGLVVGSLMVAPMMAFAQTAPTGVPGEGLGYWQNDAGMVFGTITAISGNIVTVQAKNGTTYTVDASNASVNVSGQASSVASLVVGNQIAVQGQSNSINGTQIVAKSIHSGAFQNESASGSHIFGTITAISGNTVTIQVRGGSSYTVDAAGAAVKVAGQASSLSSLAVGNQVMVKGQPVASGSTEITATSIISGALRNSTDSKNDYHYRTIKRVVKKTVKTPAKTVVKKIIKKTKKTVK